MTTILFDRFGQQITYLSVSVTGHCNFRCNYFMAEDQAFLPRRDLLSLEELGRLCGAFIDRGMRLIRLTVGRTSGALSEVTITTNGSRLPDLAPGLYAAGVRRINISLDTLDQRAFARISRWATCGRFSQGLTLLRRPVFRSRSIPFWSKGRMIVRFQP